MSKHPSKKLDVVGPVEIAPLLGVRQATVYRWRERDVLPEPGAFVSGGPVWHRKDIIRWAEKTGRRIVVPVESLAS